MGKKPDPASAKAAARRWETTVRTVYTWREKGFPTDGDRIEEDRWLRERGLGPYRRHGRRGSERAALAALPDVRPTIDLEDATADVVAFIERIDDLIAGVAADVANGVPADEVAVDACAIVRSWWGLRADSDSDLAEHLIKKME